MVKVQCHTPKGGSAQLSRIHRVWASYAVARAGSLPAAELLYAGATLPNGQRVQFFLNRETGLVVVDVIDKDGKGGVEILRRVVGR